MYSLKELYRTGYGPSSSHTIGPFIAGCRMREKHPEISNFRVTLLGSLAATGKGHFTAEALQKSFQDCSLEIIWDIKNWPKQHPNGMILEALDKEGNSIDIWRTFSIGGGTLVDEGCSLNEGNHIYPHNSLSEIIAFCEEQKIELWQYIDKFDDSDIWNYLEYIRQTMMNAITEGLASEEPYLPMVLKVARRASTVYQAAVLEQVSAIRETGLVSAYALAVSEQNASMGKVVTAPTCGACGIIPAVLKYLQETYNLSNEKICQGLAVAGILGLLAKHNASVSGAEAGCQAEVGVGCAMAAGAAAYLLGYSIHHIENAAEVAMEHHLGLTCDPIGGYVMIPCIERNATAAVRALQSAYYVHLTGSEHTISYDEILQTMLETGKDMAVEYRETSVGGLAKYYHKKLESQEHLDDLPPTQKNC